jgi:hypothetical protein
METVRRRHFVNVSAIASLALAASLLLGGCVTPIPLAQEAPDLSYKSSRPLVVAVLDERQYLAEGKPATFIGRAHTVFGIPSDMLVYPWFVSDKAKKDQTLAQALEDRVVVGLGDEGWALSGAALTAPPTAEQAAALLEQRKAQRLLSLALTDWFVSVNLNWVGAFNFDWGYRVEVFDDKGVVVTTFADSGRDVVDMKADESPQNMIKMAFRERLIKILERPELSSALGN